MDSIESKPVKLGVDDVMLRPPVDGDAASLADAVLSSLDELSPWMPWASDAYDRAAAEQWISGEFGDRHRFVMVDPGGAIVGSCGLNDIDEMNRRANLGYWVRSDRAGRGYATAAARHVAHFGVNEAGLHRLEVIMSTQNHGSRQVAEKAGATFEGTARDRLLLRGTFHDAHIFSFTPDDLDVGPYL